MWRFLKKLEIELPYDPAIPRLGIHTKEARIERDMCTPMFITAPFTIAKTWKQPRCPWADEWIRKLWYTMEYYSAIEKTVSSTNGSELFIIARTWKQPRWPSADKWIRKLWYIYTMEYYWTIKKNIFESVLMRWMKLEPIIKSEVSQKEKHQYSILTHIYGI